MRRPANPLDRALSWPLVTRRDAGASPPSRVLTRGIPFHEPGMPAEIAMLLPAGDGPGDLIDALVDTPAENTDFVLGLFLASPLLHAAVDARRLRERGVRWVANLPSVGQQDEEFAQQLDDVGLGLTLELRQLAVFRDAGFSLAVVVTDADAARAAASLSPAAMIVLPRVADFAAGFPSLRQRASAVRRVGEAARAAGHEGLVLGLGEARDAGDERLWPARVDGLLCRPATPATG